MTFKKLERLDNYLLWTVCFAITLVLGINFATSFGHIRSEGLTHGELGFESTLMPIGIDGMLLAIALANVFAARFGRGHWLLRVALAFGVLGTVAANGAYGAGWGLTGGLLATWSPVALFIAVEAGLFMFRIVADMMAEAAKAAAEAETVKRGRPVGSKNKPKETTDPNPTPGRGNPVFQAALPAVIKGHVDPVESFRTLRETGTFAAVRD
jgi:hypothetical protein